MEISQVQEDIVSFDIFMSEFVNKKSLFYPYFHHNYHLYYFLESEIFTLFLPTYRFKRGRLKP